MENDEIKIRLSSTGFTVTDGLPRDEVFIPIAITYATIIASTGENLSEDSE